MADDATIIAQIATLVCPEAERAHSNLMRVARAVVFARYFKGDGGWDMMNEAIGALESLVGRPMTDGEI
jgi:hypothetical protein